MENTKLEDLTLEQIKSKIQPIYQTDFNNYKSNPNCLYVITKKEWINEFYIGRVCKSCSNLCEEVENGNWIEFKYIDLEILFEGNDNYKLCIVQSLNFRRVIEFNPETIIIKNTYIKKKQNKSFKEIEREYAYAYANSKMSYLNEEEFGAMKYFESLMHNIRYRKKGRTLDDKFNMFFIKYPNITKSRIISINNSRNNHFGQGKKEHKKLIEGNQK